MSDYMEAAAITAVLVLDGVVRLGDLLPEDEHHHFPMLSNDGDADIGDIYIPVLAIIGVVLVTAVIWAVRRLAPSTRVAKPTEEGIWIPSASFVSHMVVGANRKEDPEIEKIEEIFEEIQEIVEEAEENLESVEEKPNPDEESLDSVAREIIEIMETPSPGEPMAKSTPNEETAGMKDGMIKRVTTTVTITKKFSPKK